jgi:hypothetical protein
MLLQVVDDQICYPLHLQEEVWKVYQERVRLFKDVYTHRWESADGAAAAAAAAAA